MVCVYWGLAEFWTVATALAKNIHLEALNSVSVLSVG